MQQNLGRVKGSMWYAGTAITGTSTTPTAYATGITYALEQDLYLNTETGNVYSCDTEGSQSNALWVYIANIMGPVGDIVDNLHTDNGTKALSARQGKVLNEKLLSSGVYPKSVDFDIETAVYIAEITIQNIDGTITLRSADDSGSEEFTKIGTSDTYTVSVDIDSSTGFSTTGAILNNISFTGNIYSVVLKDSNADTILSQTFNVWESLNEALGIIKPSGAITDGSETLKTGKMYKDIEGTTTQIYPITHAKGVWYDKANNVTVKNAIDGKATKAEATTNLAPIEATNIASQSYTVGSYLVYNGLLYKVTSAIAQGGTLQVGVNIQQTKVGSELNTINNSIGTSIASALTWKLAGTLAGGLGQTFTFPTTNYREIAIKAALTGSNRYFTPTIIIKGEATGTQRVFIRNSNSSDYNTYVDFNFSTNVITNQSNAAMTIYYR